MSEKKLFQFQPLKVAGGDSPLGCYDVVKDGRFPDPVAEMVWEREYADLFAAAPALYDAMQEFVDRVDRGEVRSKATYGKFKAILAQARGEEQR